MIILNDDNLEKLLGHHGTTKVALDRIMVSNFTLTSIEKGWFGRGVYFFEDDKDLALEWVQKEKSGIPKVIEANIEVPSVNFLDLTDVKSEDYQIYAKVRDDKINQLLEQNNVRINETKYFEALVMEILKKDADIFVVKVPSLTKTQDMKDLMITLRIPNCYEIVVSELRFIKKIREIASDEYE